MVTTSNFCLTFLLSFLFAAWLMIPVAPVVGATSYAPVYHPTLHVPRTTAEFKIDGNLDEPGWKSAGRASNFAEHQPGDQTQPPVETEALITYDDKMLYVAFVCYDDPGSIRASLCERDRIFSDDNVVLLLDTYGNASWAYELVANPYGVQGDLLYSNNGVEDSRYDMTWESAGRITDIGYQVEMAIPFAGLRFPDRAVQTWKVDFWRNHPRDSRGQYSWAAYDRDEPCWLCQWGTVTGIKDVQSGKGIEIMPTVMAHQSGARVDTDDPESSFDNAGPDGQMSLSARYAVSSSVTTEVTYNPDFSQVEGDAAQIDVNTNFALFYPERRPFFQEGSDLFNTHFNAVYTRAINDPEVAAKLTGRIDRTSVAFLVARDEHSPVILPFEESSEIVQNGRSTSGIFRARRAFGEDSHLGAIITDRRFDGGGSGSLYGIDGALSFFKNYRLEIQALGTHTEEPDDTALTSDLSDSYFDGGSHTAGFDSESFSGHGLFASVDRHGQYWFLELDYMEKSPTFRADLGFVPINNRREVNLVYGCSFHTDSRFVEYIEPLAVAGRVWNFDGNRKDEWFIAEANARLKKQTYVSVNYMVSWEKLRGIEFPGIKRFRLHAESNFSEPVGLGFQFMRGHTITRCEDPPVMGRETSIEASAYVKPSDRLRIEPTFSYGRSEHLQTGEEFFEGFIARTRVNYQFTREVSLRLVVQYHDFGERWDIDPLLTYRLSPFSVFYVGTTYDYGNLDGLSEADRNGSRTYYKENWMLSARQFFMKLQYLFQV